MKRLIKLEGIGGGISMQVENNAPTVFPLANDIKATELFKALDFHRGCQYKVECGASGELAPGAFDGFCGLIEDIVQGINKISDSSDETVTKLSGEESMPG